MAASVLFLYYAKLGAIAAAFAPSAHLQKGGQNIASANDHKPGVLGDIGILFVIAKNLEFLISEGFISVWGNVHITDNAEPGIFQCNTFR